MCHLGRCILQEVPDTFGFNGIDASQTTGDTVALKYPSGIGLRSTVKFRWNGNGVRSGALRIPKTAGHARFVQSHIGFR
jgi:hypothetical protein